MWGYPHLKNLHVWWSLERILRAPTKTEQVVPWVKETCGKRPVWNWYQTKNWYGTLIEYVFRIWYPQTPWEYIVAMNDSLRASAWSPEAASVVLVSSLKARSCHQGPKRDQSMWWWALKEGKVQKHTRNRTQNSILPNHEIKRSTSWSSGPDVLAIGFSHSVTQTYQTCQPAISVCKSFQFLQPLLIFASSGPAQAGIMCF